MTYVELLVERYKAKGLLIDSNLLLLYFIGTHDSRLVGDPRFKKLAKYTDEDFQLLLRLKGVFRQSVTTAHVLTEVSNLTNDLPEQIKRECLCEFAAILAGTRELAVPSFPAAQSDYFPYLGLTDSVLAQVARDFLIVTDDARLVIKLAESHVEALNFRHLFDLNQFSLGRN